MKGISKISLLILLTVLNILNVTGQKNNCILLDDSQQKLYLNGENFRLLDNALRCFKLNSVAGIKDSIIRIWILEEPDSLRTWSVNMFEFGKKDAVPFATVYKLQWGYESKDTSLPVKCITQENLIPKLGWVAFEKDIRRIDLLKLYKKPLINNGFIIVDYGMLITQFLFGHTTNTVDLTGLLGVANSKDIPNSDNAKRMLYLLFYIKKHFSIKLTVDSNGHDYLDGTDIFNTK
jgi:hypothetical protein